SGLTIAYAWKRPGQALVAESTEFSSPGILAMSAACATPCRSSSPTQVWANSMGSSAGRRHPSMAPTSSRLLEACAARAWKNRREKKCVWASETARSPQRVCIRFVQLGDPGGHRELREAGHVVHPQFLHHGLAITAHRLQSKLQQDRDLLAGLAFVHE